MIRKILPILFVSAALAGCWPGSQQSAADVPALTYSKSEFVAWVQGRTEQEVIAKLGEPRTVEPLIDPGTEYYDYTSMLGYQPTFAVVDDTTGLPMKFVTIDFDVNHRATMVQF